jgi:hypothetical protein
MDSILAVSTVSGRQTTSYLETLKRPLQPDPKPRTRAPQDRLDLGKGEPIGKDRSMQIILDRAMEKLRAVVDEARTALGIPEDAQMDTSPDATAGRIADFALGAFPHWLKQHPNLSDEDARKQFAAFIGGAIDQGIAEARDILRGLNALLPDVDKDITATRDIIQNRLNNFVAGKK